MKLIFLLITLMFSLTVTAGNGGGTMKAMKSIDDRIANVDIRSNLSLGLMFQKETDSSTLFAVAQKKGSNWQVLQFNLQNRDLSQFNHLQEAIENSKDSGDWFLVK